jgi:tetratricopeptide (TPR) repeat protein
MAVPDLQDAINHLQKQDVDGAIATLERKIDELPAHLTAHVLLARAHEAKQQWEQALTCWENVYFLIPNSPVAREGKRRVLRKMDRGEEADDIEEVAPAVPGAPTATAPEPAASTPSAPEPSDPEPADEPAEAAPAPPPMDADDENAADERETAEDILSPDDDGPTTAPEAVSELEKLRQQAEEEARQGGARAGLGNQDVPSIGDDEAPDDDASDDEEDDLDRLIEELESARIEPTPDMDDVPAPDLENDVDDLVSETLARIHEAQEDYRRAAQIYVKLASQDPDQARTYLEKAAEMRRKAEQQPDEDEEKQ